MKTSVILAIATILGTSVAPFASADQVVYPTGQMPRDSDTVALTDKVNYLDEAGIAHRKSIGNLYATKVDTAVFEADQKRQDKETANVSLIAQDAHSIASEANENTGIIMNKQSELETTVDANRKRADAQVTSLKGELNQKVDGDVYIRHTAAETADRADLRDQTQKLWEQKASTENVDELRQAHIEETAGRIQGDRELDDKKADKSALADEAQQRRDLGERTQKELNTKVDGNVYQQQLKVDQQATRQAQVTAEQANAGVADNRAVLADHSIQIEKNMGAIHSNTTAISQNTAAIQRTSDATEANASDIRRNTAAIADQGTIVANHEVRISNNEANISALNSDLQQQASATTTLNSDLQQSKADTQKALGEVRSQQDEDRKEYRSGISTIAAMANLPTVPGHTFDMGAAVGNFANSTSVAVGGHYRPSENNVFKASAGFSNNGKGAFGLGYSYGF